MSQLQLPNGWHFVGTTDDNRPTETDMGDTPIARIGFGQILEMPGDVITVAEDACRRIDVLARELDCLGFFSDDGDDGPRAA
jgi:hypothetical protein